MTIAATDLKQVKYKDLPELIQEYVIREVQYAQDDKKAEPDPEMDFDLVEFDPSDADDREMLEEWLADKIEREGEPDHAMVDGIGQDGEIRDPILIWDGQCGEGRHRLAAALKYNLKIKAYIN